MRITIGTRGSALALWQARRVAEGLAKLAPATEVAIVVIKTEGDRATDVPLSASGGRGVFVREIEEALREGTIDLAVHSLKDLPAEARDGLVVTAVPERGDPRDALVAPGTTRLRELREGALLATGSPRRRSQILRLVPTARFVDLRGNVDTRLRKLDEGACDGLVLAAAGLTRLGIDPSRWAPLPPEECLPAPGQGALAVEARAGDGPTREIASRLGHDASTAAVEAERSFLAALGAGCLAPAGALAVVAGGRLTLEAMVAMPDGSRILREQGTAATGEAMALGLAVAEEILARGGSAILEAARGGTAPGGA